jgi:serine protease AprX
MATITINGISVDPEAPHPAVAAAALASPDTSDTDYILVQTSEPLTDAQKQELKGAGADIVEYVPEDTYICYYPPVDLTPVRTLPFVAIAIRYMQGFKIAPTLRAASPDAHAANLTAQPVEGANSRDAVDVDVVLHGNVYADDVKQKIAAAAGLDPEDIKPYGKKFRVRVPRRRLEKLAAIDEVRHVEEYVRPSLMNTVAIGILRADKVHSANPTPLLGAGQVVAVCDTGFDKGSTSNVHPAFTGRVAKLYPLGRPKANDPDGHGTHVAGSILGDATSNDPAVGKVRGSAPKAKLVMQSVLDNGGELGGIPNDLHDLFGPPYTNDGARIHSNSWGFTSPALFGVYNSSAGELDDFVWNHRDLLVCVAAGNDGSDSNADGVVDRASVSPPGTAKNCITVGASENRRTAFSLTYGRGWPTDFPALPLKNDRVANNPEGMAAFSSRGPTRDQRFKPDVVAPGTFILSARSRDTSSKGWQLSSDPLYMFEGGTSMATPLVAGSAALVREFLQKKGLANPSAALVKALLINGAHDMTGQYVPSEAGPTPNINEGFGRVDVAASIAAADTKNLKFFDEGTALTTGNSETRTITVAAGSTLKVTLAWTDPAGETLQNDLDLIVRANNVERHGNVAAGSTSFDRRNNVEQVVFENLPAGNVVITVTAFRTTVHAQPYALVVREL